jgi:geranylgeranyl pyrophosphate synthase
MPESRNNNSTSNTAISCFNGKRFAYAVGMLTLAYSSNAFAPLSLSSSSSSRSRSTTIYNTIINNNNNSNNIIINPKNNEIKSSSKSMIATSFKSSPVVVSEEAEALSHSETTLKLIPSYELFQILTEEEGGTIPETAAGNSQRDETILKIGKDPDTLSDIHLSDFVGLGGKTKIETLPDPFKMVEKELKPFADSISELVSSDQPILSMAAKHFFEKRHGKRFRPVIVQLVAKAVAAADPEDAALANGGHSEMVDGVPSPRAGGVSGWEWSGASDVEAVITPTNHQGSEVWRKQAQLGQIVEMIHVASLIHDDVLDEADTRRGGESVHKLYSNKVAVLAGDYLLARASVLLARLENTSVVQIMATALESLISGEVMQLKSPPESLLQMESYLKKSYYKTASLICYACRSTALLGGHSYSSTVATAVEEFGFHLGLAFQIQDDILDFTAAENVLGKPALADMDLGLSTAPILYAAQEYSNLKPLVKRRFKKDGDKQTALEYLYKSDTAMNKAKALAQFHAEKAVSALLRLPQSEARDALIRLTHTCITRKK